MLFSDLRTITVRPIHSGLGATLHAELRQQAGHVVLDGLLGEEQPFADLAVGQPVADQAENLTLARGERREPLIVRRTVA